jgi:hypothetical protein
VASRIGGRRQQPGGRRLQVPSASSGRRVLGERGELPLACRGARVLVGQEEDGIGDPARVGEGCRRETLPRVDPSSGWMPAATISNATWMARGRLSSAAALVIARPPNDPAAHRPRPGKRAPRRAAGDLHESRCPAVHDREASASGQQGERRAAGAAVHESKPSRSASTIGPAPNGPGALASVCGGRVHHELDSTVSRGGLL